MSVQFSADLLVKLFILSLQHTLVIIRLCVYTLANMSPDCGLNILSWK